MDLDNDGIGDILSGSYSRMENPMAGLFQVLWGQADGTFKKAAVLTGTDGEPLIIPADGDNQITENICTRPFAVDWDSDGHLDLIVGNFAGGFYLFAGEGSGKFRPQPEVVKAGGAPLKINGAHSDPFPVDWDGDGDLDLLSGTSNGGVYWAENVAPAGDLRELKPFVAVIEPGPQREHGAILREEEVTGPVSSTRIWVDDVNSDGKLDILVGDWLTLISPVEGLSEEEFARKQSEWQTTFEAILKELNAPEADAESRAKLYERYSEHRQERNKFMREEMTGFVWLYLQK